MDRRAKLIFYVLLIASILIISINAYNSVVEATGGAFPYTKHGAATAGQNTSYNGGVDRSTTGQWPPATGAGTYQKGECTHCHEPHGSFGGNEPYPSFTNHPAFMTDQEAEGPDPYLLFADDNAKLCWTCHETFSFPGKPTGWGYYGFYQGMTVYQSGTHGDPAKNQNMLWPGIAGSTIHPRKARPSTIGNASQQGICLNCHTPHGILGSAASPYDIDTVPAANQLTASNPSVTTDYLIPRQLNAWEEKLCETCHSTTGPVSATGRIMEEIDKRTTGSGHPVDDTTLSGRHVVSEALPITTKHVECYDCHNPHADKSTNRLEGMKYVDISGAVKDPAVGDRQPYIYEVCFKCHGQSYNQVFANDTPFPNVATNRNETTYPKHYSNKRREFDPNTHQYANYPGGDIGYNTAYHPVAAPGRNGTYNLFMQLQNAFGLTSQADLQNLTIQCTDCHNNDATSTMQGPATYSNLRVTDKTPSIVSGSNDFGTAPIGPHGSARKKLLRGNYVTTNSISGDYLTPGMEIGGWYWNNRLDTNGRPKFELCFICHEESRLLGTGQPDPQTFIYDIPTYTNFGKGLYGIDSGFMNWNGNLHMYHLDVGAVCHDCHHNVHSNVEAQNTIYGDGMGGQLPPDNHDSIVDGKINTHLINFGPQASGQAAVKPRWYWEGTWFRCNLVCHGRSMALCGYQHGKGGMLGVCGGTP